MTVSEVISAAMYDGIEKRMVHRLIDELVMIEDAEKTALICDYLKPFSDDWENQCDKYAQAVEALKQIPVIRRKYIDKLKKTTTVVPLVWVSSELETLNARLMSAQEVS